MDTKEIPEIMIYCFWKILALNYCLWDFILTTFWATFLMGKIEQIMINMKDDNMMYALGIEAQKNDCAKTESQTH